MKKILVVTDFSEVAKNASLYAIELAKLSGAKVLLYDNSSENNLSSEINALTVIKDEESKLKNGLEVDYLNKLSDIDVELLETKEILIKGVLLIEKNENIDLVIMGVKESADLTGFIIGNIITDLIKETLVPLMIIPEATSFKKIKKIVFAVDFNLETELKMHKPVKDLLQFFNPEIFVLNVVKENEEIMPDNKISEYNIEKYFENESHIYSFIENNDLINGLKDFIFCNNIDMITMLPHNHNFLQNIFIESNTKKMVFNTPIPLIIFPLGN